MLRFVAASLVVPACLLLPVAHASAAGCQGLSAQIPSRPTVLAPIAAGLAAVNPQLGTHRGVLASAADELQSLENVLLRLRQEGCKAAALAASTAARVQTAAEGYVKKTEFDNTPYRFNMTQNGKRMTADDYDAWLQANGYSAGRRVDPNAQQAESAPAAQATEQ